ncbi:unnamed protein product [Hymenolepis diminuta]|uniref:Uncharacterized protein n=1 Tax=Hymenolepis diminuta TaxID=6216 RepID=A0A0R3SMR1_HYMDI|nr:unnamed protein product [Hymenolepis diminuta]
MIVVSEEFPHASTLPRRAGGNGSLPPGSESSGSSSISNKLNIPGGPGVTGGNILFQPPSPQATRRRFPPPNAASVNVATQKGDVTNHSTSNSQRPPPPVASRPEQTKSIVMKEVMNENSGDGLTATRKRKEHCQRSIDSECLSLPQECMA